MIANLFLISILLVGFGYSDVLDRAKSWTDEEVDAAARKWGESSLTQRGAAAQHEGLARWQEDIINSEELPQNERIALLGGALSKISMFNLYQVSKRIEVYDLAQQKLLSIPGHATYYRDKINALREQLNSGQIDLDAWSERKYPYFEALGHMPSEEAVEVLGEFAEDKYGWTGSRDPGDWNVPGLKEYRMKDWAVDFTVWKPACMALENLGIENAPVKKGERVKETKRQELWSQWWQEVKTGKRKYRFKGSDVEHPVSGTIGTKSAALRQERRPTPPDKQTASPPAGSGRDLDWFWPALIFTLLVGGYLICRKSFKQ
jgi:hypothetical protein